VRNSPEPSCGSVVDVVGLMLFHFLLLSWRISDQQVGIDEQWMQDHAQFGFQFTPSKQERMSGEMGRQCGKYALQQS
jgi:hypothetical protein